jgi:quinol monooxygenase YgiN
VVIVGGAFDVDPVQRDAFIEGRLDGMRRSRAEEGCLEYTMSADPLDPGRVLLYERWASQEALDAHLSAMAPAAPSETAVAPLAASITIYTVSSERRLV